MKKICLIAAIALAVLLSLCLTKASFAQRKSSGIGRRVLVGFKDGTGPQAAEKRKGWVRNFGGDVHHSFHFLPLVSAKLPENLIAKLKGRAEITYVEDDIIMHAIQQETPWGVDRIDADLVWPTNNTGTGVDVAILDTGIDYDHPDLIDNISGGVNYAGSWWRDGNTNKRYWNDGNGHGSHCAGIVAAENNTIGVVGVAPGANLWAVKVLSNNGSGYVSDIIQGLEWCVYNGIEVASMSFGGGYSESLKNACDEAYAAGVLLIAAAGNEYGGDVIYPAAHSSVIAVSATDDSDNIADFSSVGLEVELAAPGVSIYSTYKNGGYAWGSGTSMACPHVTGAAALVLAGGQGDVRTRLQETAKDLGAFGKDNLYGYGRVDAAAAAGTADKHDVAVTAITAPGSLIAGEMATIEVTVKNEGTYQEIFDVVLTESPEEFTDTKNITLAADVSTTVSFSWNTIGATVGNHSLTIMAGPVSEETDTADNSRTAVVNVEAVTTDIAITAVDAPSPVTEGDVVSVYVTVENLGNQNVATDIKITLLTDSTDGVTIGAQTISGGLAAGISTIVTFNWDTSSASTGNHTLTASHDLSDDVAGNNSNSTTVTVQAPEPSVTDIAVTTVSAPSSVVQGNVVSVNVTVENVGNQDVTDSIDVTLTDDTNVFTIGTQTISGGLAAGASTILTFNWNTNGAFIGNHTLIASHNFFDNNASNDSESTVIGVEEKPAAPTMHVGDISFDYDVLSWGRWGSWYRVTAIVSILDSSNAGVKDAAVDGSWSGAYNNNVSGTTNGEGIVTFRTSWVRNGGTFTFTVNSVTKTDWIYDLSGQTIASITLP